MVYRVVHCGTGYVGKNMVKLLLQQPHLKLVGQYVNSPEKIGKDTGEIVGVGAIGVRASNSWKEMIDLKADVLLYAADTVRREREAIEDIIPFLEAGTNVISTGGWALGHRKSMPPDLMAKVDAACERGNSSVLMNACDPGWATSDFAIATLGIANKIDQVRMIEFACFAQYPAEYVCREYFGFGQPKGFKPQLVRDNLIEIMWAPTLYRMADVLDVNIDEFKVLYETDSVDRDLNVAFGKVKAGTAAVVHFELQALNRGRPFIVLEHIDTLLDNFTEAGVQWSKPTHPHSAYRIEVQGDPAYSVELQAHNTLFNSTPVLNCIPALVAAPRGLLHPLDLARYYGRNLTARTGPWP